MLLRHSALVALSALGTEWVAQHTESFLGLMMDPDEDVSFVALCALTKLPHDELAPHARRFRACLRHPSCAARCGALRALSGIGAAAVAESIKSVCARLSKDVDVPVRREAAVALAVLPPSNVPTRVITALHDRLNDPQEDPRVRTCVVETLAKLRQSAQHTGVGVFPGLSRCTDGLGGLSLGGGGDD